MLDKQLRWLETDKKLEKWATAQSTGQITSWSTLLADKTTLHSVSLQNVVLF